MRRVWFVALLVFATPAIAQEVIPAGIVLPLQLNSSLNSTKVQPGQTITATLMQDVPLPFGSRLRAGAKVVGHVVSATQSAGNVTVTLRFDSLRISKKTISVTTSLRALASSLDVDDAQLPTSGPDRGTSQNAWTTAQIGGDVVYRGGGPVAHGLQVVGKPVPDGVLVRLNSNFDTRCRGEIDGNHELQATWVFSASACGVYGFSDLDIAHAGRTAPVGEITLSSAQGNFNVRSGSGLLLRVN